MDERAPLFARMNTQEHKGLFPFPKGQLLNPNPCSFPLLTILILGQTHTDSQNLVLSLCRRGTSIISLLQLVQQRFKEAKRMA